MSEEVASSYLRLLSLGVVWMSVHCAGMCGPIVAGFDLSPGNSTWWGQVRGVLQYQGGRASIYAVMGAAAGLFGASLKLVWGQAGGGLSLLVGSAMLLYLARRTSFYETFKKIVWRRKAIEREHAHKAPKDGPELVELKRPDRRTFGQKIRERLLHMPAAGIGAVMAALPCMIPAWVLTLAATTGSVVHGSLLMVLTVVLTTPILILARLVGAAAFRIRGFAPLLQGLSATWLVLVGLAALDFISHRSVGFSIAGKSYMLMLF